MMKRPLPAGHVKAHWIVATLLALLYVRVAAATAVESKVITVVTPDFVFPTRPISFNQYCFFTQVDSRWIYSGPKSLVGQHVGIMRNHGLRDRETVSKLPRSGVY